MAKNDGKYFRGSTGPAVHRVYRGEQIIQSKPVFAPGSQTKDTKKAAGVFGQASTLAASIRDNLYPLINDMYDGPMIARLNTEVLTCLRRCINTAGDAFEPSQNSFSRLDGFEFNAESPLTDQLFVEPQLSLEGNIFKVNLPDLYNSGAIQFLNESKGCFVNVAVGFHDLTNGTMSLSPVQSLNVERYQEAGTELPTELDFEIQPGCLCVAAISIEYYKNTFAGKLLLNSKTMNPTMILAAFMADGDIDAAVTKKWSKTMKFKLAIKS